MSIRFAMCNEFCEGMSFEEACNLASEAGYEGLEVAPFTIKNSVKEIASRERTELREIAEAADVEIVGLHWLLTKPEGLYINHPDDDIRARTRDYLGAEIDFCSDMGGTRMIVGSPQQRNVLDGHTYEGTWERTVNVFEELAPHAQSRGVTLCIEPLAPAETNFIKSAEEARRLVEAVDHPKFRMMLDVKAMCGDVEPIPAIIRESAAYLEHFHANDASLRGPGSGDTDFEPIVEALKDVNYSGWVSVEVFDFSQGPETIAFESIDYLKSVFD